MTVPFRALFRRAPALGVLAAVAAGGCTWLSTPSPFGGTAQVAPVDERAIAVYEAVVRRLVARDHSFGGGDPGFTDVYIVDGPVRGAARFTWPRGKPRVRFSETVKSGLEAALPDLPPLTFVRTRSEAYGSRELGGVKKGGVLLTLGPILGSGERVEVGTELWMSGLGAQWLTYVVRFRDGDWRVTGTTGPMAIA